MIFNSIYSSSSIILLRNVNKTLHQALDQVRPNSKAHASGFPKNLSAVIKMMRPHLKELMKERAELERHFQIAYRGIVQEDM
jgi:hypothetical protein